MDVKLPAGGGKKELRIELYDFDSSSDHDFLGALRSPPCNTLFRAFALRRAGLVSESKDRLQYTY